MYNWLSYQKIALGRNDRDSIGKYIPADEAWRRSNPINPGRHSTEGADLFSDFAEPSSSKGQPDNTEDDNTLPKPPGEF